MSVIRNVPGAATGDPISYVATLAFFCCVSCVVTMMKLLGFRASMNFINTGRKETELNEPVSVTGSYRINRDEFFGNGSLIEPPKRATPSMVKLPPSGNAAAGLRPTKSSSDLVLQANQPQPPLQQHRSVHNVSLDPRGASSTSQSNVAPPVRNAPSIPNPPNAQPAPKASPQPPPPKAAAGSPAPPAPQPPPPNAAAGPAAPLAPKTSSLHPPPPNANTGSTAPLAPKTSSLHPPPPNATGSNPPRAPPPPNVPMGPNAGPPANRPAGPPKTPRQLKKEEQERKKLEKRRLAEEKARQKAAAKEQARQEKLRKETERKAAREQARIAKMNKNKRPAPQPGPPPGPQPQRANPLASNAGPPQPPPASAYSTNTLESSISRSTGPPPYSEAAKNEATNVGNANPTNAGNSNPTNVSFGKPIDKPTDSWDMISQHREQLNRPAVATSAPKGPQKNLVMDLQYKTGTEGKANSEA